MANQKGIMASARMLSMTISQYTERLRSIQVDLDTRLTTVSNNNGVATVPSTPGTPFKTREKVGEAVVWAVDIAIGHLPNATLKMVPVPSIVSDVWADVSNRWIDSGNSRAYNVSTDVSISLPYSTLVAGDPDAPTWTQTVTYLKDDIVIHNDYAYRAKSDTKNNDPEKNSGTDGVWLALGHIDTADIPRKMNQEDVIDVYLKAGAIFIKTVSDRTDFKGIVRLKYLKA